MPELPKYTGAAPVSAPPTDKAGFWKAIDTAIANLGDVSVATLLTNVTADVDEAGRLKSVTTKDAESPYPAIVSNLNLISGNVTTVMGPSLKDDDKLTTFHQSVVDKAVKVLPDNLNTLVGLVEGIFGKKDA